ncbi:MAG TPA: hypothetical protein VFD64_15295 [Gemmatimonadaceae bacterium]|nr:hypothetical protein [Gemmatimonadaceae bacterium]
MTDPYMTENPSRGGIWVLATLMLVVAMAPDVLAQIPGAAVSPEPAAESQWESVLQAMRRIPLAAALGALLAFRPRRKGTPARTAAVVQTQIILAIVGAVVMLVVGSSVARAFGIVGAASLVRYRAKIDDPKDAGIMLSTLGIGLASGVGLWGLAIFSTVFVALVVGLLESFEPEAYKLFDLKIKAKDAPAIRPRVQLILRRNKVRYELRSAGDDEIVYETRVPAGRKTDGITEAIHAIDAANEVEWDEKKPK